MNNQVLLQQEALYEIILTLEVLDESSLIEAKDFFESYKLKQIILNDSFLDSRWKFCDEYSNVGIVFKINTFMYKKYYQDIFGIDAVKFIEYLKTYIMLTMGKNILNSLREIVNDIKRLINTEYVGLDDINIKITRPNHINEFFNMLCICQLKKGPRSNSKKVHYSLVFNQEIVSSNLWLVSLEISSI